VRNKTEKIELPFETPMEGAGTFTAYREEEGSYSYYLECDLCHCGEVADHPDWQEIRDLTTEERKELGQDFNSDHSSQCIAQVQE